MASNNYNQRLPDLQLPGNKGVNNSPYPYVEFWQGRDGSWIRRDVTPNNTSHGYGSVTGTFKETDNTGAHKELNVSYDHSYTQGGTTATVEGNHDHKVSGSNVKRVSGDHYHEHGGDHMVAVGGELIHAVAGSMFMHSTAGVQMASTGDHTSDFNDGSHYHNIACNDIKYVQGTKYTFVGQEHGTYVPNGSSDTNVSNNTNFTSGNTFSINSNTKVTITVGQNKTIITILPNSVIIHDGNGNEVGMSASKMWVAPPNPGITLFLGGNGSSGNYSPVVTLMGPALNVVALAG